MAGKKESGGPRGSKKRMVSLLFGDEERALMDWGAKTVGMTRGAFVRRAIRLAADNLGDIRQMPLESHRERWRE
jgi:hypothetical protein